MAKQKIAQTEPLQLRNTLSGKLERFSSLKSSEVTLYSCGPTVYDYVHIGNLRSFILADILKRTLILNGYKVRHTMNLTDFGHLTGDIDSGEDKVVLALRKAGKPMTLEAMREFTQFYSDAFKADMEALNTIAPTTYTPASDYVKEQIALIKTLDQKGYTYETSDGLYFDISCFPEYGKLGNIDLDSLKSGARIEVNTEKKHPADFAVWKKGELGWDSPWGKGFPGWHIECTAMAFATLGKQIDIHTGGEDLAHTHHNGEIAQAEAATSKKPYVKYWLHNAFITIEHTKVSKSLGNTIRLNQLVERGYPALSYRYWLLGGHYRSPMNFTFEGLNAAKQALYRLKRHFFEDFAAKSGGKVLPLYKKAFTNALNDDLDTPKALSLVWKLIGDHTQTPEDKVATLKVFDAVLGLGLDETKTEAIRSLGVVSLSEVPESVKTLIGEREKARAEKRWDDADILRQEINLHGYLVEDTPKGTRIVKV